MTTAIKGLVKIGKTGTSNFEGRMATLENNGYYNTVGLKRALAVEVEDYYQKEQLVHTLLGKSRVGASELFAVDIELVQQLLLAFEGDLIYPKNKDKDQMFEQSADSTNALAKRRSIENASYPKTPSDKRKPTKKERQLDTKISQMSLELKPTFDEISDYYRHLSPDVKLIDGVVSRQFSVDKKSFASIRPIPTLDEVRMTFKLPVEDYVDESAGLIDLTNKGHWGAGNLEMRVQARDEQQIAKAKELLKKAFLHNKKVVSEQGLSNV
jgi:predicted transport protein